MKSRAQSVMRKSLIYSLMFALIFFVVVLLLDGGRTHEMHYWKSAFMTAVSGLLYFVITYAVRFYRYRNIPVARD